MHNKSSSHLASPQLKSPKSEAFFAKSQINFSQNSSLFDMTSPKAFQSRIQTDSFLEQIEKDIKSLDQSFSFQWDEELSMLFAAKCIKQATEKLKVLKNNIFDHAQESPAQLYLKLKKLESSLESREKIVRDTEASLGLEKIKNERILKEIQENAEKNLKEKKMIEEGWARINEENTKVAIQMKNLDKKYEVIMETLNKANSLEEKNSLKEDSKQEDFQKTLQTLQKIQENIKKDQENIKKEQEKLTLDQNDLNQQKLELSQDRSSYEEERKEFLRHRQEFQEITEKSLKMQKNLIESPSKPKNSEILAVQLTEINELKTSLITTQEKCLAEHHLLKQEYSKKLEDLLESHKTLKNKFEELDSKEKVLESFTKDLEKEKNSFQEVLKLAKNAEKDRENLETLKSTWEDLQSEFSERSKMLEIKENLIILQEKALFAVENGEKCELLEIYSDVKVRMQDILEEESQVLKIQRHAVKVKKENEITADLLKTIHEELIQHQSYLEDEHEKLKQERKQIEVIFFKLENQAKNLEVKEEIVLNSMERLSGFNE